MTCVWMCILYSYKHMNTNISYRQKHEPILKGVNVVKIVSKIKKHKTIEGGGRNKQHYIPTVPQETQRSLFSQKTLNIADAQSSSSIIWLRNTDQIKVSCVHLGVQQLWDQG